MPYHCHSQRIARRRQPWLSSLQNPTFSQPCNNLPGFIPLFSSILPLNPFSYSNTWGKNNNNVSRNGQGTELGLICIILWCNVCNSCSNPNFSWQFFWCEDSCKGISDKKKINIWTSSVCFPPKKIINISVKFPTLSAVILCNIPPQQRREICLLSTHSSQDAQVGFHFRLQPSSQYLDHLCIEFSFLFCPGLGWKHYCNTKYGVWESQSHCIMLPFCHSYSPRSHFTGRNPQNRGSKDRKLNFLPFREQPAHLKLWKSWRGRTGKSFFPLADLPVGMSSCWSSWPPTLLWWRRAVPFLAVPWQAPCSLCSHWLCPTCVLYAQAVFKGVSFSLFQVGKASPPTHCGDEGSRVGAVNREKKFLEERVGGFDWHFTLCNPKWTLNPQIFLVKACAHQRWLLVARGSCHCHCSRHLDESPPAHSQVGWLLHMMGWRGRPGHCRVSVSCGRTRAPCLCVHNFYSPLHPATPGLAAMFWFQMVSGLGGDQCFVINQWSWRVNW